jgi:hypothetical protein
MIRPSRIPPPAPMMQTVLDSERRCIGFTLKRGPRWEAFDRAGKSCGLFDDQAEARGVVKAKAMAR